METQGDIPKDNAALRSFTLAKEKVPALLKYGIVTALTLSGLGLTMGGILAWLANEKAMFFAFFVAGAIFVAAGSVGFLKCFNEH